MKISFWKAISIAMYLKKAIPKIVKDKKVTFEEAIEVITTVFGMLGINVLKKGIKI